MKKIIFTQEWMAMHPYGKADDVDQYYTNLANRIYHALDGACFTHQFGNMQDAKMLALCLAAYFEDVLSDTGIWKAFTTECMARYGVYVPFYLGPAMAAANTANGEDTAIPSYRQGDLNIADIKFLLWHHYQQSVLGREAVPPLFGSIEIAARMVYNVLDAEYETAPENVRMREFISELPTAADRFFDYRNALEWFHYGCYFNVGNQRRLAGTLQWLMQTGNYNEVSAYAARIEATMGSRDNLLALSSAEWLAKISEAHPAHKLWTETEFKYGRFYAVKKTDDEYVYLKDTLDDSTVKLNRKSLDPEAFADGRKLDSYIFATLFRFGESWWLNGTMRGFAADKDTKKEVAARRAQYAHKDCIKDYNLLKSNGFGAQFLFADKGDDVKEFLKSIGYDKPLALKIPAECRGIIVFGTPYTGLGVTINMAQCICSPDNPYYDSARAAENCFDIICGRGNAFPYEIVCMLIAGGMLPDANVFTSKYIGELGLRITQENLPFLADYYLKGRRDKDLSPQELW